MTALLDSVTRTTHILECLHDFADNALHVTMFAVIAGRRQAD